MSTVDCPYCGEENDMTDALCDGLSDDNKLDWECQNCEKEFEVYIEFEPSFSASKIEYAECDMCGNLTRDIYHKERIFPFPKSLKDMKICYKCWIENISGEF